MKRVILLLLTTLALTSCIQISETKSVLPLMSEQRHTAVFERIRLQGSPALYYTQSDSVSVRVEAPEDILKLVETHVENSCLTVQMRDNLKGVVTQLRFSDGDDVKVYVSSPDLIEVTLAGSGEFKCNGKLDTDNLKIELRGSGDIDFEDIICDRIETLLVGSGDLKVGHVIAQQSAIELVGSGDLKIEHENVARTDITLKGSGDVEAGFQNCGEVVSELRGSGDIKLAGDVFTEKNKVVGSGTISVEGLSIRETE